MGSDTHFAAGLLLRVAALVATLAAFVASFQIADLAAARLVAGALAAGAIVWLWHHVTRSNRLLARFIEAVRTGDGATRFGGSGAGGSFDRVAAAFDGALARLGAERLADADALRFHQALLDDVPVALLLIDADGAVEQRNKAARRLFGGPPATMIADYERFGASFARRLAGSGGGVAEETLVLTLGGRPQRAIVRTAEVARLAGAVRAVTVQPAEGAFDMVEMATQSDLVRVLTHEILNSLTPVTSLAQTAAAMIEDLAPDDHEALADARAAIATLAHRAQGLTEFVQGYRAVAQPPEVRRRRFPAAPWAEELARLLAAEWPALPLVRSIVPDGLILDADPDLLAQVLINLLRNAAEAATGHGPAPEVRLSISAGPNGSVQISVADNGPGIAPALRQDIFLPFFTTKRTGSGIGLNLARQIVVAHGGTIDVAVGGEGATLLIQI